jgi:hypothetical protein
MIGFYLALPFAIAAFLRLLVAAFNYFSRPILPNGEPQVSPLVSVLIPARNEENTIGRLLSDLQGQTYQNLEVIVYNDQSTDKTLQVINEHSLKDRRVRAINGISLPEGWIGKNHACHCLAQNAKGEYIIFLDADVRLGNQLIANGLHYMLKNRLSLLTLFPKQQFGGLGERITVPLMQWILLTLLPLKLVMWSKRSSLSAANGQMMMFEASSYKRNRWHERFKGNPVEDILIGRATKRERLRMATLLGTNDITCRMYTSYREAVVGFSKNVCQFFGGNRKVMLAFAAVTTLNPFVIVWLLPFPFVFLYFFSVILSRMMVGALCEQSLVKSVLLMPLQQVAFLHIVYKSYRLHKGSTMQWKGREVALKQ